MSLHIVTDSCAHGIVSDDLVAVVPNRILIGGKTYVEGVDITSEEALKLMAAHPDTVRVQPPTPAEFVAAYKRLAPRTDGIISIHASREMFPNWRAAKAAAAQLVGHCKIEIVDSMTFSAGQAMLVKLARRAINAGDGLDDVIRQVRGAVERVYTIFFAETMDFLLRNAPDVSSESAAPTKIPSDTTPTSEGDFGVISASHAVLGTLLGIKPVLTVEHGRLIPIEKVRTRLQAVERLVEFAIEFEGMDDVLILTHKLGEHTRMLIERLQHEFPEREFPQAIYSPSLAALIGLDATGLVILESELSHEL